MATAKKRTTSDSGAYMSQYDQEVEKRLTELESKIGKSSGENCHCEHLEEIYNWYLSVKSRV